MVYETDSHVVRAREHIESNETDRLAYACLELRFALERITYQKLQLRLDKVTIDEIGAWQPRKAMDRLMDLVDEHLDQDSILRFAPEKEYGVAATEGFTTVGESKGVSPKDIGKHWQKLGSYLHIRMPKKKGQIVTKPNESGLQNYLYEVINYIEEITKTTFDSHFSNTVRVDCSKCKQGIVRNSSLLKEGEIVQCQNENCNASYIVHLDGQNISFEADLNELECKTCGKTSYIEGNALRNLTVESAPPRFVCSQCDESYLITVRIEYGFENKKEEE